MKLLSALATLALCLTTTVAVSAQQPTPKKPDITAPAAPTMKLTPFQEGLVTRAKAIQEEMSAIVKRQSNSPDFNRYLQLQDSLNTLRVLFESPDPTVALPSSAPAPVNAPQSHPVKK